MPFITVTCPTCFQAFEVAGPEAGELPTEWDYDCEICCRPMRILFNDDGEELFSEAIGLDE